VKLISEERLGFCKDISAGLCALHKAEVAHGDMKPDNILVFDSRYTSRRYQAKLSDFGSIISLKPSSPWPLERYYGTPLYNAPEVADLQRQAQPKTETILRCDIYALGLSMCEITSGELEEELSRKDSSVISFALKKVKSAGFNDHIAAKFNEVFQLLLPFDPEERCVDLVIITDILDPFLTMDITKSGYVALTCCTITNML
jgi:serine/threonine protein kinase